MTRILFLSNAPDRLQAAAAWLATDWSERKHVVVFALERSTADRLDHLLWSLPSTGFLPHCRIDSPLAAETPILLADRLDALPQDRCLLNLGREVPPGFSRFEELVEIDRSVFQAKTPVWFFEPPLCPLACRLRRQQSA